MATVYIESDPNKVQTLLNKYVIKYKTSYYEDILFISTFLRDKILNRQD